VLKVDSEHPSPATLADAAGVLQRGGLVAFPTETFYGLGAAALDRTAVRRVFALKGRSHASPLLILADSVDMVARVAEIPDRARPLMARHWPGPLTLVFRARRIVPDEVTGTTGTVGVRVSSHAVARALVGALGAPITATSANPTGMTPPTRALEVVERLRDGVDLVLDGGDTQGGLPSTVLDVTVDPPRVIRPGAIAV
jgi:L-threonylcarbamoyladenylate synthase